MNGARPRVRPGESARAGLAVALFPLLACGAPDASSAQQGSGIERPLSSAEVERLRGGSRWETGSTWDLAGRAVDGPLTGASLEPIPHGNHFWFAWAAFHPETTIWHADGETPAERHRRGSARDSHPPQEATP